MTVVDIRKHIVEAFFNKPILGKHYIDWHTEDGECGLTLMIRGKQFDIVIREK